MQPIDRDCPSAFRGSAELGLSRDRGTDARRGLHQLVSGHEAVVWLLVERGVRLDIRDTVWQGTPLGWALLTATRPFWAIISAARPGSRRRRPSGRPRPGGWDRYRGDRRLVQLSLPYSRTSWGEKRRFAPAIAKLPHSTVARRSANYHHQFRALFKIA